MKFITLTIVVIQIQCLFFKEIKPELFQSNKFKKMKKLQLLTQILITTYKREGIFCLKITSSHASVLSVKTKIFMEKTGKNVAIVQTER